MGPFILSVLMQFFLDRKGRSALNTQGQLLNAVTVTLKKEISELILKISIGLVATGVLIYSLINLGQYLHEFLLKYQYGVIFSVLFFIALAAGCIFLLFNFFYVRPGQANSFEALFSKTADHDFSFEKIYMNFLDGLNTAMSQSKTEKKSSTEKKSETEASGLTH